MFTTTFSGELINVALRQLGATRIVETRNGIMYKVEFKLSDDLTVTYVFDVTKHDKYYIQRIAPYPISHGDFASADEVIECALRMPSSSCSLSGISRKRIWMQCAGALRTVWIRCAKSTAARRRSIRNKKSVISAQRQHAAAQDDEKTEVHAHCQRLRLTAGMCLGFVLRGERQ